MVPGAQSKERAICFYSMYSSNKNGPEQIKVINTIITMTCIENAWETIRRPFLSFNLELQPFPWSRLKYLNKYWMH